MYDDWDPITNRLFIGIITFTMIALGLTAWFSSQRTPYQHLRENVLNSGIVVRVCHRQSIYRYEDKLYLRNPAGNIFLMSESAVEDLCKPIDLPEVKFRFKHD